MSSYKTPEFSTAGIMPKDETQATLYLKQWPEYDGRGVIVAIFDTGVDPGAAGLKVTTDGKPKILDIIDCSGSGDVELSIVKEAKGNVIEGISGRSLKLGNWDNPSKKYSLGVKRGFDLVPRDLAPRVKKERKEEFDLKQREAVNALQREIAEWKQAEGKPSKKELEARLEQLTGLSYDDTGPVHDVIAFQDSKGVWRVVVDKKCNGDLTNAKPLADYCVEREFDTFSSKDLLNYSIKIYNNGASCSIVTNAGSHGTHVAGIVAAYFPDQPELNGIAPGAQIISVKIGDSRLGSMETGPSMVRGLIATKQWNCDLINMSYGEPPNRPNTGRFPELATEFVNNHKIIFVCSAGNNGPALATVGSPGGTTADIIGVGAMISPSMMKSEYSLREELPETQYTWSSRGPADDGSLGVSISAPGGAIAPVPNWTLKKSQLMNGTSMSSPNACGNIALVVSGLKATGTKFSPHSIKLAIENTAKYDSSRDHWTQGHGLLQTLKAFEYAKQFSSECDLKLVVSANDRRGVYLKEASEVSRAQEITIKVEPVFHKSVDNSEKIKIEKRLVIESTVDWVKTPSNLLLPYEERSFKIFVDPTNLSEGPHFGMLRISDSENPRAGFVGVVPITVIKPQVFKDGERAGGTFPKLSFEPGKIRRYFFSVPVTSSWATITLKSNEVTPKKLFVLQWRQNVPHQSLKTLMNEEYVWLEGNDTKKYNFKVFGGHTMEVLVAQYWSAIGTDGTVDFDIDFHGFTAEIQGTNVQLAANEAVTYKVGAAYRSEKIVPKAVLSVVKRRLSPVSSVISPMDSVRDLLPDGKQIYGCINTYSFSITEASTILTRVVGFDQMLYDSPHEAQFWMIFDENKQRVHAGDFQPESVSLSKKGKYTVRVLFRHDNVEYLKSLKNQTIVLERHLPKDKQVSLTVYGSSQDALVGGTKFPAKGRTLQKGDSCIMVVAPPADAKLPKDIESGDTLQGYIVLRDLEADENVPDSVAKKGLEIPPGGIPLDFVYAKSANVATTKKGWSYFLEEEKTATENFEETLRVHAVDYLSFLIKKEKYDLAKSLLENLLTKYSSYLPLLKENVHLREKLAENGKGDFTDVVKASDLVLEQIDTQAIAMFIGVRHDDEESSKADSKAIEEKKDTLINVLHYKARALLAIHKTKQDAESKQAFFNSVTELNKWAKVAEETKFAVEYIYGERLRGNLANAIKAAKKKFTNNGEKDAHALLLEIIAELGWKHWVDHFEERTLTLYPANFTPF